MIMMQKQSKLHEIIKKRIKNINERTNKKYRGGGIFAEFVVA